MIYATRDGRIPTSTWWWCAGGIALAAVLGVLLALGLAAVNGRSGPDGASAQLTDANPGRSGLGDAAGNPAAGSGGAENAGAGSGVGNAGTGSGGVGTGSDEPGTGDSDPDGPQPTPDGDGETEGVTPSAEDCVSYDPAQLHVEAAGDAWRMRSGGHLLKIFDTKADAEDGVKVARNWTRMCFIGRGNDRPEQHRYIFTYWQQHSGLPFGPAPKFDCVAYDPAGLTVHGPAGEGWRLRAGGVPLLLLDTAADAARAKLVAGQHRQLCRIGAGNDRPDPARYLLHHWRQ